jgi:RNA polymerase sigma factor (sigma-70 family)
MTNELEPAAGTQWPQDFRTTHWSVVLRAGRESSADSAEALEKLCRTYWFPIYAFVRRRVVDPDSAQDLTQEFFARLIGQNLVGQADPERGKFRAFVLTLLKHFLSNHWERERAQKRGGGQVLISLDALPAEERYAVEPADAFTPDQAFDRKWAEETLARVQEQLQREYEAAGLGERYQRLKVYLLHGHTPQSYADVAAQAGLTESAVKSAIFRLRRRFAELFRHAIAQTVSSPAEVEEEIRHLLAALG